MSILKRIVVVGGAVLAAVGLLGVRSAQSRAPSQSEALGVCATRVSELEAEVRMLREQLRAVTQQPNQAVGRVERAMPSARRTRAVADGRQAESSCDPPFVYDSRGIKSYNPTCFDAAQPRCETPFGFTSGGIKYYEPSCLDFASTRYACDPPFFFDAQGVKRYKSECL
jgi:outer membrane murein-binding lipoprotein Lpp